MCILCTWIVRICNIKKRKQNSNENCCICLVATSYYYTQINVEIKDVNDLFTDGWRVPFVFLVLLILPKEYQGLMGILMI